MRRVKDNLSCLLRLSPIWCHFALLLEVTGAIIPCMVSSGRLWLYRLLSCASFQAEFRLFKYCSYERLFIPYFIFVTLCILHPPFDRMIETGLKWRYLSESACVQVKLMIFLWLIFLFFQNCLHGKHRLDTTEIFGQSVQRPHGWVELNLHPESGMFLPPPRGDSMPPIFPCVYLDRINGLRSGRLLWHRKSSQRALLSKPFCSVRCSVLGMGNYFPYFHARTFNQLSHFISWKFFNALESLVGK